METRQINQLSSEIFSETQLTDLYQIVFGDGHSTGFRVSEMKGLIFDEEYWFTRNPKENWGEEAFEYLKCHNIPTEKFGKKFKSFLGLDK